MTIFEFLCATEGYGIAHGAKPKGSGDISDEKLAEMGIAGF